MGLARQRAGLPTIVVGDIDRRRGVRFRSKQPSRCRPPRTRRWSRGLSRSGRPDLLAPSLRDLNGGHRVHTLPWHPDPWLDSEDAPDPQGAAGHRGPPVRRAPATNHNFTDVDALGLEPDLDVVFASDPGRAGRWPIRRCWAPEQRSPI